MEAFAKELYANSPTLMDAFLCGYRAAKQSFDRGVNAKVSKEEKFLDIPSRSDYESHLRSLLSMIKKPEDQ